MTRCSPLLSSVALACALWGCLAAPAALAQGAATPARNFPETAQRGELQITAMPEVTLNGKTIRTTPGFRLFSQQRTLVFASNYAGQKMLVGYVIEPQTQGLHTAWILTAAEIEKYKPIQPRTLLQRVFGS